MGRNAISIILILTIGTFFYSYKLYIKKLIQRSVIANIRRDLLDFRNIFKERDTMNQLLDITEINTSLLYYIKKVLDGINWEKYIPQRLLFTTDKAEKED